MITTAIIAILFLYLLWVHYLAVMDLKRSMMAGTLKPTAKVVGTWVVLPIGLFLDWAANFFICTVIFLDLPGEFKELVTGRLQRYADIPGSNWRKTAALWFSAQMLDDFDPDGPHIKRNK